MNKLSNKREAFCRYIGIDGLNASDSYRKAFDTDPINQASIHEQASKLLKIDKVSTRIQELKASVTDRLASEVVWDKAKIISELAINVEASRNVNQFAASSRALELIGKAVNVFQPETQLISGTVEILHKLPDSVLAKLESLNESGNIESGNIDSMDTIEAGNYQVIEPDSEAS